MITTSNAQAVRSSPIKNLFFLLHCTFYPLDIHQVGHIDGVGSSSTNDTSISKSLKYFFDKRLDMST